MVTFSRFFGLKTFYVYTISHPDGTVLYVGKGHGEKSTGRIASHLYAARGSHARQPLYDAIRNIWAQGGHPIVSRIQVHMAEPEALELEMQLILYYGYDNLFNRRPRSLLIEQRQLSAMHM